MHKATKSEAIEEIEDKASLKSDSSKISQHWWNSVPQFDEERKEEGKNEITINVQEQERIETINSENNEIVNNENTTIENKIEQSFEFSEEQKVCDLEKENFSNVLDRVFPNHLPSGLQIIPKKRKLKKETQESLQSYDGGYSVRSRNHPSCYDDNVNVTIKRIKRKRDSQPPVTKWKREIKYSESDQMGPDQFYPGQQQFQNYNYQNINSDRQTSGQTFTPSSAGTIKTELTPILSDTNSVQSPHYDDSVELEEYVNNDDVLNILDSKNSVQPAMNDIKQEMGEISNVMDNSPNTVKMEQVDSQSVIDYSQSNKRVVTMFPVYLPEPNGLDPQDDKLFTISRSQMEKFRSMSMLVVRNEITLRDAALASGIRKFTYSCNKVSFSFRIR